MDGRHDREAGQTVWDCRSGAETEGHVNEAGWSATEQIDLHKTLHIFRKANKIVSKYK